MIERSDRTARGVAYSTRFPQHLLNVLPASMSGLADDSDHLLRWLVDHGDGQTGPPAFVRRSTYGDYLSALLGESIEASAWAFEHRRAEAVGISLEAGGVRLTLGDGGCVDADRVVLAIGNLPPRSVPLAIGRLAGGCPPLRPRPVEPRSARRAPRR